MSAQVSGVLVMATTIFWNSYYYDNAYTDLLIHTNIGTAISIRSLVHQVQCPGSTSDHCYFTITQESLKWTVMD